MITVCSCRQVRSGVAASGGSGGTSGEPRRYGRVGSSGISRLGVERLSSDSGADGRRSWISGCWCCTVASLGSVVRLDSASEEVGGGTREGRCAVSSTGGADRGASGWFGSTPVVRGDGASTAARATWSRTGSQLGVLVELSEEVFERVDVGESGRGDLVVLGWHGVAVGFLDACVAVRGVVECLEEFVAVAA